MTRLERVIMFLCPNNLYLGPYIDSTSYKLVDEEDDDSIGCRGITCKECWNKECD